MRLSRPSRYISQSRRLPLADLRREVSKKWIEIDTRNLQFHLYKMQVGIVRVEREAGREVASLAKEVVVKVKER